MKRYIKSAKTSTAYTSRVTKPGKFNEYQAEEIHRGQEAGVDVVLYSDPKYDAGQMKEIRLGLESSVDVKLYADPEYFGYQMEEVRKGLEKYTNDLNIDTSTAEQIAEAYKKNAPSFA